MTTGLQVRRPMRCATTTHEYTEKHTAEPRTLLQLDNLNKLRPRCGPGPTVTARGVCSIQDVHKMAMQ